MKDRCSSLVCLPLSSGSGALQVFGNSPDETAFCRLVLNKETVPEALTAIQPTLMAYGFDQPVQPVLLDVSSILPDRILLLDSYFYVIVFHGATIAQWRAAGYHQQEEHAAFRQLLEVRLGFRVLPSTQTDGGGGGDGVLRCACGNL